LCTTDDTSYSYFCKIYGHNIWAHNKHAGRSRLEKTGEGRRSQNIFIYWKYRMIIISAFVTRYDNDNDLHSFNQITSYIGEKKQRTRSILKYCSQHSNILFTHKNDDKSATRYSNNSNLDLGQIRRSTE